MSTTHPVRFVKGRGAGSNVPSRFETWLREVDDGAADADDGDPAPATRVSSIQARGILSKNNSPDIGFDLSINPYQGCEHVITRHDVCD